MAVIAIPISMQSMITIGVIAACLCLIAVAGIMIPFDEHTIDNTQRQGAYVQWIVVE